MLVFWGQALTHNAVADAFKLKDFEWNFVPVCRAEWSRVSGRPLGSQQSRLGSKENHCKFYDAAVTFYSIWKVASHLCKEDYLCNYLHICPHQPLRRIISWHSNLAPKHQDLSTHIITVMGFHSRRSSGGGINFAAFLNTQLRTQSPVTTPLSWKLHVDVVRKAPLKTIAQR